ncbi:MAG: XdhC family protein [Desulfobulbaceae bacterium]|nr:XdhC family protein [Desulfobulbaceae bacterium]
MDDLSLFEEVVRLKKSGQPATLVTVVATKGSTPRKTGAKMLVHGDGTISGTIGGGKTEADTIEAALRSMQTGEPGLLSFSLTEQHGHVCGGDVTIYLEPLHVTPLALIIGAGHVGRAVGRMAGEAGFLVRIIDTSGRSDAKEVIPSPVDNLEETFAALGVSSNSFLFIATSEHKQDFVAAAAALKTCACYVGVLGSTRKRAAMENFLQERGYPAEDMSRIISPAGLDIRAETPEEIAVSVVAQMIQQRRTSP